MVPVKSFAANIIICPDFMTYLQYINSLSPFHRPHFTSSPLKSITSKSRILSVCICFPLCHFSFISSKIYENIGISPDPLTCPCMVIGIIHLNMTLILIYLN